MEAKDIKWCPQHGYPLPCYKCGMPLTSPQQKEIFKAGYEEAVRFTHRQFDRNLPEIMELLKQEGRREVLAWEEEHNVIGYVYDTDDPEVEKQNMIDHANQLKKWEE